MSASPHAHSLTPSLVTAIHQATYTHVPATATPLTHPSNHTFSHSLSLSTYTTRSHNPFTLPPSSFHSPPPPSPTVPTYPSQPVPSYLSPSHAVLTPSLPSVSLSPLCSLLFVLSASDVSVSVSLGQSAVCSPSVDLLCCRVSTARASPSHQLRLVQFWCHSVSALPAVVSRLVPRLHRSSSIPLRLTSQQWPVRRKRQCHRPAVSVQR